jgi:hypothetical protein
VRRGYSRRRRAAVQQPVAARTVQLRTPTYLPNNASSFQSLELIVSHRRFDRTAAKPEAASA